MAKVVNITDKLEFDVDPTLVVGNLTAICRYKKDGKKLSAKSLMLIVNTAIELVTGEDEGEQ